MPLTRAEEMSASDAARRTARRSLSVCRGRATRRPLYVCQTAIDLSNLVPTATCVVRYGTWSDTFTAAWNAFELDGMLPLTAGTLTAPVVASVPEVQVELWTPLVAGESIFAAQTGCHANGQSSRVSVVNGKPGAPLIRTPVRPGDTAVDASNLLPGARVYLTVNGFARTQTVALDTTAALSAGSPALANGDQLDVIQSICTLTSAPGKATVQRGSLKVSLTPNSLVRAEAAQPLAITTDEQTGAVIDGIPVQAAASFNEIGMPQGPSSSGFTGTSFSYTPGSTIRPPPCG